MNRPSRSPRLLSMRAGLIAAAIIPALGFTTASHAWLGGFEPADGYRDFFNPVQGYNAGAYGPNGGYGGGYSAIPNNTGLWEALQGGFTSGGATSYVTGHFGNDRTYVNSNGGLGSSSDLGLVLTTGHEGWGGPALKYQYHVDAPDLGGTAPASTGGSKVSISFWARGQLQGASIGGSIPDGYYGNEVTFQDSSGNIGFRLGLTERAAGDKITYWNGSSMVESALVGNAGHFDRWDVTLDLAADTFSASYFEFNTSTLHNLVISQPMQTAMAAFTDMTFSTSPGVTNAKLNAIDDFSFRVIPAPGAAGLLGLGGLLVARRRR